MTSFASSTSSTLPLSTSTPSTPLQPPSSLRGQRLLSEEDYISSLSSLIQRDFFPNLPRLTAENEYLAALEDLHDGVDGAEVRVKQAERSLDRLDCQDLQGKARRRHTRRASNLPTAAASSRNPTPIDTPVRPSSHGKWDPTPLSASGATPRTDITWATPRHTSHIARSSQADDDTFSNQGDRAGPDDAEELPLAQPPDLSGHSISSFQRHFTSEDNASFLSLVQSGNDRRKQKYAWAFQLEHNHNARRKLIMDEAIRRADEGYARSMLALPEARRRKFIQAGKVDPAMAQRVLELEELNKEEGARKAKSNGIPLGGSIAYDMTRVKRAIRATSEEGTSTSAAMPASSASTLSRTRSCSPPFTLKPLKHSLDPRSEVLIVSESTNKKVSDDSDMEDPTFDPLALLRRPEVMPTTATTYAGTKYAARNALFFGPDAETGTTDRVTSSLPDGPPFSTASEQGASSAERLFNAREKLKSQTVFHNTALPSQGVFPEARYPDLLAGKDNSSVGTSATPRSSRVESALGGGSRYGNNFDEETGNDLRYTGPTVNGFGFVSPAADLTPNRAAMEEELADAVKEKRRQRLLAIQGGTGGKTAQDGPRSFFLPPTPRRDELATSLANKSASSSRNSAKALSVVGTTNRLEPHLGIEPSRHPRREGNGSSRSSRRRSEALSPAARTLLDRSTRSGFANGLGGGLFAAVTRTSSRAPHLSIKGKEVERRERKESETLGGMLGKRGWEDDTPKADSGSSGRKD